MGGLLQSEYSLWGRLHSDFPERALRISNDALCEFPVVQSFLKNLNKRHIRLYSLGEFELEED